MLQVRQFRTSEGARTLAVALIAGSLVALAGIGGYEVGSVTHSAHAAATTVVANPQPPQQPQDPAPIIGLQP